MDNIDKYLESLYIQEEFLHINEADLKTAIDKISVSGQIKSLLNNIKNMLNPKDPMKSLVKIKSAAKRLPTVKQSSIDKFIGSKFKEFKPLKKMAEAVLKNSVPGLSDYSVDAASSFLAFISFFVAKNEKHLKPKDKLKLNIKDFVARTRKFGEEYGEEATEKTSRLQKEDIPDLAIAWTMVVMGIVISGSLIAGAVSFASSVMAVGASIAGVISSPIVTFAVALIMVMSAAVLLKSKI